MLAVLLGVALMTLIVVDFAMTSGLGFVSAANQANELRAGYLARSGVNIGLALLAAGRALQRSKAETQAAVRKLERRLGGAVSADAAGGRQWSRCRSWTKPASCQSMRWSINKRHSQPGCDCESAAAVHDPRRESRPDSRYHRLDYAEWRQRDRRWRGDFYMGLKPPYQPRYGPMPTIGDLQMVQGFNEAIFNRVSPFLTVMPRDGDVRTPNNAAPAQGNTMAAAAQVNANTAPPQVLAALEPELMEDQKIVQEIVEARAIRAVLQRHRHHEPSGCRPGRTAPFAGRSNAQPIFYDYRDGNLCGRPQNHYRNLPSRNQRHRHARRVA